MRFGLLCLLSILPSSLGHGYLNIPVSRNAVSNINNGYCSWSGPIPCTGDAQSWNQDHAPTGCGVSQSGSRAVFGEGALSFRSTGIKTTYTAGQVIDMEVKMTAYHGGRFDFKLQDVGNLDDPVGSLWESSTLLTVESFSPPCDNPSYCGIEPCIATKSCAQIPMAPYTGHNGIYSIQVKLPDDIQCTHCVLQWIYVTANSCGGSKVSCDTSEHFWNCADLEITGGSGPVSPVPSASFTNAPIIPGTPTNSPTPTVPGTCEAASAIVSDFWCQHVSTDGAYTFVKDSNIFDRLCACGGGGASSSPAPTMEATETPTEDPTAEPCSVPYTGYPNCMGRIDNVIKKKDSAWLVKRGLGSRCSIQQWLYEKGKNECPSTTTASPVGDPSSSPTESETAIGIYDWTWNGRATHPAGATMGVAFSGWANIASALSDSAGMMDTLPGDKYISIGGGNANGYLYPSTLVALNTAIEAGDLVAYQGVCYDVELGDAGMAEDFAASFAVAKDHGFKVLVTISHSAPYGFTDKVALMDSFFKNDNIDMISPQLYTSGFETANDYVWDGVPWSSYAFSKAAIVPSIVTASYYADAVDFFSDISRSGISFDIAGFIQWKQS